MNKKLLIISTAIVVGALGAYYTFAGGSDAEVSVGGVEYQNVKGTVATSTGIAYDLIGTQTATSTTGVSFPTYATSTYSVHIGKVDTAAIFMRTTAITNDTGGKVNYEVLASNDENCHTATTTTSGDVPLKTEITWYDAAPFLLNRDAITTLPAATTSLTWVPTAVEQGRIIPFANLTAKCLALRVSASSTSLYAQIVTKTNKEY